MSTENSISNLFLFRSSHRKCSIKKVVLKIFPVLTGKHLCRSQLFIKLKRWLQHKCFLVNTASFLKTPILKNICEQLRLFIAYSDIENIERCHSLVRTGSWVLISFYCVCCFLHYLSFLLLLFVESAPSWSIEVIFSVFRTNQCSCL